MLKSQLVHLCTASIFVRTALVIGSALVAVTGSYVAAHFVGAAISTSISIIIISCFRWLQLSKGKLSTSEKECTN